MKKKSKNTLNLIFFQLILFARQYNLKITRIHEKFARVSNYTLAARFQAKENNRCFEMISKVLIAGFFIVCLGLLTAIFLFFNLFPQLDTVLNLCFIAVANLPPLVICPAIIYSVDAFRNHPFLSISSIWEKLTGASAIMPVRKGSTAKCEELKKETETYFNQLAASWT